MVSHLEKNKDQDCLNSELLQLLEKIENLHIQRDQNIRLITQEIQNSLSIFRGLLTSLKSIELNQTENSGSTKLMLQKWKLNYMETILNAVKNSTVINPLYLKALKDTYVNKRHEGHCTCGTTKGETSHRQ